MGQGTPLAQDQDRRFQTLEAVLNTAEEVPHRACCVDTERKEGKEKESFSVLSTTQQEIL